MQSNAVKLKRRVSLAGIYFVHRYGVRLIFLEWIAWLSTVPICKSIPTGCGRA
jgi:hypothetical protein